MMQISNPNDTFLSDTSSSNAGEMESKQEEEVETDTTTTTEYSRKVIKLSYSVKRVSSGMEANPTPLVRTRGYSTLGGRDKGFTCNLCPDSGATVNVISERMVNKKNLTYDKGDLDIDLIDATGKEMAVLGIAKFYVVPRNNKKKRLLRAIVSSDLVGDPLIGWEQMSEWGLLSKSFPEVVESEEEDELMLSELGSESAKAVKGKKRRRSKKEGRRRSKKEGRRRSKSEKR